METKNAVFMRFVEFRKRLPVIINSEVSDNEMIYNKGDNKYGLRSVYDCSREKTVYYKDRAIVDEKMAVQYIKDLKKIFLNTPFEQTLEQLEQGLRNERIKRKVCAYCGGEFKGLFTKVCASCQKEKDY